MNRTYGHLARLIALIGMMVSALALVPGAANAQGPTQSSSFQVLNLSNSVQANIQISFINPDGSLAAMEAGFSNPEATTVDAGQSKTFFGSTLHVAAGFKGSVVISSDQPVQVISNLVINTQRSALGSYIGVGQGGSTLFFPIIQKGNAGNNSTFNVQNTGTAPVTVNIDFVPEPGKNFPDIPSINGETIAPGAAKTYDQSTVQGVNQFVGSATVTVQGSGTIAGVANVINSRDANAYRLFTYNGFTQGSTTVLAPLIQENNNRNRTSINCQNLGQQTTTVQVTYTPEPGNPSKAAESKAGVVAGGFAAFLQQDTGATKFVGSATITSNPAVPLACVINQSNTSRGTASAYEGFSTTGQTNTVIVPLVQSRNGTASSGFVFSSVNAATVDGTPATFTIDYVPAPGFADPPNEQKSGPAVVFLQSDVFKNGSKFVGGARVTADKPIVAIINQSRQGGPAGTRDVLSTYDAFAGQ